MIPIGIYDYFSGHKYTNIAGQAVVPKNTVELSGNIECPILYTALQRIISKQNVALLDATATETYTARNLMRGKAQKTNLTDAPNFQ